METRNPAPRLRSARVGWALVAALVLAGQAFYDSQATGGDTEPPDLSFDQAKHVLHQWLGMWTVLERHFDPSGKVIGETKGTEEIRPILKDRAIQRIYRSAGTGEGYEAHGTFSYDEESKTFLGSWFDNQSTVGPTASAGRWNGGTRTMIYENTRTGRGGAVETYRVVERFIDADRRQATTYRVRNQELTKLLEVSYSLAGPCPEQKASMRIIYDGLE